MRPQNIGIHAMEIYFPKIYVNQQELEQFDNVSTGKYTAGLGQINMAFVDNNEDVNSISLTALQNLLQKYNISPRDIGRLEVGTETLLDKSKSVKTVLMQIFKKYGNHNIEGVTSTNACYGCTNAFFNTVAWIESSAWDGRYGIVIGADVAVYASGSARPTGGCGAVAMLIGPNAPIVLESLRSSFFDHAYDFYKPNPRSEYPIVDGQHSITCYLNAIDQCYDLLQSKLRHITNENNFTLNNVDYLCFHTPFGKMVQKSFLKLAYQDIVNGSFEKYADQNILNNQQTQNALKMIKQKQNFNDREVQKNLIQLTNTMWNNKVAPTLQVSQQLGNIYTGALFGCLISLIDNIQNLKNTRVLMFSYGSGLASSMFLFRINENLDHIAERIQLKSRLQHRIKILPQEYDQIMSKKEQQYAQNPPFQISNNLERLFPNTYYLTNIDAKWQRQYKIHQVIQENQAALVINQLSSNIVNNTKFLEQPQITNSQPQRRLQQIQKCVENPKVSKNLTRNLQNPNEILFSGFYKKSFQERIDLLKKLDPELSVEQFESGGLTLSQASLMIENCIGKISIPLGLGLNFLINGKYIQVPMAVEEPSVIAAVSGAAKTIADNAGGFKTYSTRPIMIGQIQVLNCDMVTSQIKIDHHRDKIIELANKSIPKMVQRGGGCIDCKSRIISSQNNQNLKITNVKSAQQKKQLEMLIVELYLNVCESMGANVVNTVSEKVADYIQNITGGRIGIKILTNLCDQRRAAAEFLIPVKAMSYKHFPGDMVAQRIMETYQFAQLDIKRATTHNKGTLNGMDAVAIAFGQDWRAIEAAAHAFSFYKHGTYQPLTHYEIIELNGEEYMKGILEIPIAVGSQGGVINSNPIYQNNFRLAGFPNAQQLSEIIAAVGLAQNFGALRALALEGIQKGHMALHAKNIALSAGVPTHLVEDAVIYMKQQGKITIDDAKHYLEACDQFSTIRQIDFNNNSVKNQVQLSTFYVKLKLPQLQEALVLNVALDCYNDAAIHISFEKDSNSNNQDQQKNQLFNEIQKDLFGPKQYQ